MSGETLVVRGCAIPCETIHGELRCDRKDKHPVAVVSFVFGVLEPELLATVDRLLWLEVGRRYLDFKKRRAETAPTGEVIGRISFQTASARVEYEFSAFTRDVVESLDLIRRFLERHPEAEEIRGLRGGPFRVRFRGSTPPEQAPAALPWRIRIAARAAGLLRKRRKQAPARPEAGFPFRRR